MRNFSERAHRFSFETSNTQIGPYDEMYENNGATTTATEVPLNMRRSVSYVDATSTYTQEHFRGSSCHNQTDRVSFPFRMTSPISAAPGMGVRPRRNRSSTNMRAAQQFYQQQQQQKKQQQQHQQQQPSQIPHPQHWSVQSEMDANYESSSFLVESAEVTEQQRLKNGSSPNLRCRRGSDGLPKKGFMDGLIMEGGNEDSYYVQWSNHVCQWRKYFDLMGSKMILLGKKSTGNRAPSSPSTSSSWLPPRHLVWGLPTLIRFTTVHFAKTLRYRWCLQTKQGRHYDERAKIVCLGICTVMSVLVAFGTLVAVSVVRGFLIDASDICRADTTELTVQRPLVEYYVHGRGNGHFSRSIAIIQVLNAEGIDVRMFIGRASMWREINKASSPFPSDKRHSDGASVARTVAGFMVGNSSTDLNWEHSLWNRSIFDVFSDSGPNHHVEGTNTAISVSSIVPSLSIPSSISHILERLTGDCQVAQRTGRFPILVVSDGDMPGMLRAFLGRIPSISISHGMTFGISNPLLQDKEWKQQATLNRRAGLLSDWRIGTNFMPLPTISNTSVVARSPMRREIVAMAKIRQIRKLRKAPSSFGRNKVVLCYFRDRNGDHVVRILMEMGFDVLVFNPPKTEEGEKIGKRWKIDKDSKAIKETTDGSPKTLLKDSSVYFHQEVWNHTSAQKTRRITVNDKKLFPYCMSFVDGIVSSGGSQLLSESIFSRIPIFALYKKNDNEQMLNVEMMRNERDRRQAQAQTEDNDFLDVYGASIESFLQVYPPKAHETNQPVTSKRTLLFGRALHSQRNSTAAFDRSLFALKSSSQPKSTEVVTTEVSGFVEAVRNSSVSNSYFHDLHQFLDNPHVPLLSEENYDAISLSNPWLDSMPDAASVISEIVKLLL